MMNMKSKFSMAARQLLVAAIVYLHSLCYCNFLSLSMVVLNSREQPENIWLPKECT